MIFSFTVLQPFPPPPQNPPQIQLHGNDYMAPMVFSFTSLLLF
ncbi:hypothetical protein OIU74_000140 [Salix koriyanagi]|uniref:Uncharacterized protein n=1 Tax=Salix koriyanagi TaxID=2511006 RepID=A0A9Q1ALM5_9ROSI|nr:hypothetical protein OIU74_000140 [Salix koriyanagi]